MRRPDLRAPPRCAAAGRISVILRQSRSVRTEKGGRHRDGPRIARSRDATLFRAPRRPRRCASAPGLRGLCRVSVTRASRPGHCIPPLCYLFSKLRSPRHAVRCGGAGVIFEPGSARPKVYPRAHCECCCGYRCDISQIFTNSGNFPQKMSAIFQFEVKFWIVRRTRNPSPTVRNGNYTTRPTTRVWSGHGRGSAKGSRPRPRNKNILSATRRRDGFPLRASCPALAWRRVARGRVFNGQEYHPVSSGSGCCFRKHPYPVPVASKIVPAVRISATRFRIKGVHFRT